MDDNDYKNIEFLDNCITWENSITVDVGANCGEYTAYFRKRHGGTGIIYSFELHPDTYNTLYDRFNHVKNIKLFNCAVSDIDGEIEYFKGVDSFTNNIIGHDMNFTSNESLGTIMSMRLDTVLNCESVINLIKIDVEGAELAVLKGMKYIIDRVKYILVECHLDEDWDEIKHILLNEYKLSCINILTGEPININSNRAYQCFCERIV